MALWLKSLLFCSMYKRKHYHYTPHNKTAEVEEYWILSIFYKPFLLPSLSFHTKTTHLNISHTIIRACVFVCVIVIKSVSTMSASVACLGWTIELHCCYVLRVTSTVSAAPSSPLHTTPPPRADLLTTDHPYTSFWHSAAQLETRNLGPREIYLTLSSSIIM